MNINENDDLLASMENLDADLGLISDTPDFQIEPDDYTNVTEPHWLFDTAILHQRIKAIISGVKDKMELVSRCVFIKPENGLVYFRLNTGESYIEVAVETLNATHTLTRSFVVEFKTLFSVIHNAGAKMLIKEKDGVPTVRVLGGEIQFEVYAIDHSTFYNADFAVDKGMIELEPGLFNRFLSRTAASMGLAQRPEDRRVRVENGTGYSNFLSSLYVQMDVEIKNISLRHCDISFLSRMFDSVEEIKYREAARSYIFTGPWSKVSIPKIDTSDLAPVRNIVASIVKTSTFPISPVQLLKVTTLMRNMLGVNGIVKVCDEDDVIVLKGTTKSGRHLSFPIAQNRDKATVFMPCPIGALNSAATLLKSELSITLSLDDQKRLIFDGEGIQVIFGSVQ